MKFLFLIGVEGTGHHMIRALLADYLKRDDFADKRFKLENQIQEFSRFKNIKQELQRIFQWYKNQNVTHLFLSLPSFPYLQPRESLRRPDIIDFADLVHDSIEIKYLILYRNPISATYSAIRRGFTNNIHLQAKIVESNFIYIEKQFSQLPKEFYRVLHFEEFLDEPLLYSKKVSAWWELDEEIVLKGLKNLRQPLLPSQIPAKPKAILDKFFTERRIEQWKSFYQSNRLSFHENETKLDKEENIKKLPLE